MAYDELNYQRFPAAVILSIISTATLLIPCFVTYRRKLYFECISLWFCFLVSLTYYLHEANDKMIQLVEQHNSPSEDHHDMYYSPTDYRRGPWGDPVPPMDSAYFGSFYAGMTMYGWMKLAAITHMFCFAQSWILLCQNDKRETDELLWAFALCGSMFFFEWDIYSTHNYSLPIFCTALLPCLKALISRRVPNLHLAYSVSGIMMWVLTAGFYSVAFVHEVQHEHMLRSWSNGATMLFSGSITLSVLATQVESRKWYSELHQPPARPLTVNPPSEPSSVTLILDSLDERPANVGGRRYSDAVTGQPAIFGKPM